jgi:hypothetical protein
MTGVFSILGFVAQLKAIEHDMHELGPAIVARVMSANASVAGVGSGDTISFSDAR